MKFVGWSIGAACLAALIGLWGCGKKAPRAFLIVGSDTISTMQARAMAPDTALPDSLLRIRLIRIYALAHGLKSEGGADIPDTIANDLAERLSLQTSASWTPAASRKFYSAGQALYAVTGRTHSARAAAAYTDSLVSVLMPGGAPAVPADAQGADTLSPANETAFCRLLASFLMVSGNTPATVYGFLGDAGSNGRMSYDVKRIIKGLIYDTSATAKQSAIANQAKSANAAEALRYRNQASIKASIEKHAVNLKELYKKHLKTHSSMRGTVWINFQVAPNGTVADATIKMSDIKQPEFLDALLRYVRQIQFSPIPEKIGRMSFVFPFEFTPE
jgi:TonB family protein